MGSQVNNFYGTVGAGGITESTVTINMGAQQQPKLADVAQEISDLFDFFERRNGTDSEAMEKVKLALDRYPSLNDVKQTEAAISASPTLQQRLLAAGSAASIETVKVLLPPLGVAIEAIKAYRNPGSN